MQRRQRSPPIDGAGVNSTITAATHPSRDFFVSRVVKQASVNDMKQHLRNKCVLCRDIKLTSQDNATFNSFKESVSYSDASKIKEADFWPQGIWVRKWHESFLDLHSQ